MRNIVKKMPKVCEHDNKRFQKMIIKTFILCMFVVNISSCKAYAGGTGMADLSGGFGYSLSFAKSYDSQSSAAANGIDFNVVAFIVNAGLSYRSWDKEILGWDNESRNNDVSAYLGVGLINIVQLQLGYSASGSSLRLRSDLVLFTNSDKQPLGFNSNKGDKLSLDITPFIEMSPWSSNKKYVFGIGIGFAY